MCVSVVLIPGSFGGVHPDSASGGPGERWREARTEHEADRKQIGPEPAAINHRGGARPSHNYTCTQRANTHSHTHTNMHSRK